MAEKESETQKVDWQQFPWQNFNFDENLGGAWDSPISKLPDYFSPWDDLALDLSHFIEAKTLRQKIDNMPLLDANRLQGSAEWRRAYTVLTHLTNGYVWQEGPEGKAKTVPAQLAVPACLVAQNQQLPIGLSYTTAIPFNWYREDKDGPMEAENIRAYYQFTEGEIYRWFIAFQVVMEKHVAGGIKAGLKAFHSVEEEQTEELMASLNEITLVLIRMNKALQRLYEKVSPEDFTKRIAAYYGGWGVPAFPEMVYFEGVEHQPEPSDPVNGAQSISFEAFDAILRTKLDRHNASTFQQKKRSAIPAGHCHLVDTLWAGPSVRDYVLNHNEFNGLVEAYNSAVNALVEIRKEHMQIIVRYAMNMDKKFNADVGTDSKPKGVYPGMIGPKAIRKATEESCIH